MKKVDFKAIKELSLSLRALNHKLRQNILFVLSETDKINITQLSKRFNLEPSIMSQHLAILRQAKFIKITKIDKYVYFSLMPDSINLIDIMAKNFVKRREEITKE